MGLQRIPRLAVELKKALLYNRWEGVISLIRVAVCGACGRMGQEVCRTVWQHPEMTLVAGIDLRNEGADIGEIASGEKWGVRCYTDIQRAIREADPEVIVDFTHPKSVMGNVRTYLNSKVHAVVGTTGITEENLREIADLCQRNGVNAVVAPNFALGAVLMMKMAEIAAKFFPHVEIIELHHEKKVDAPSGTSLKTAESLSSIIQKDIKEPKVESLPGVRGGKAGKVRVHSVRLPGLVAHQEIIFGGQGQTLTIRHDSMDRTSFMPGVVKAILEVKKRSGLTYGLDKLLGL